MKKTKLFILALLAAVTFASCSDEANSIYLGKTTNSGGNTGGGSNPTQPGDSGDPNNTNKNVVTANMPAIVAQSINKLEFPKVKGGTSYAAVHYVGDEFNFATEWDDNIHAQRWTCYNYNHSNRGGNIGRTGDFINDPDLHSQYNISEFTTSPYTNSGYDRGHMLASHERQANGDANKQTFYFTNMQPQTHAFNTGIWGTMESYMQKWSIANVKDTIFIAKGGTIENGNVLEYIKNRDKSAIAQDSYIPVPKYFFAAVLRKIYNTKKNDWDYLAFGFWFNHNDPATDKLADHICNIQDLQQKTGIDFFCNLPDALENQIESASVESIKTALGM